MHQEAWNWLSGKIKPLHQSAKRVLDIGGYDVNGSPRTLFSHQTDYVILDRREGPHVDIVADPTCWIPPRKFRGTFDLVLCTEVLEHVEQWRGIVYTLWLTVKPAATCLVTCATDPRPPHSIAGVEPPPPHEWYQNIPPEELISAMTFLFTAVRYTSHPRGDFYLEATK